MRGKVQRSGKNAFFMKQLATPCTDDRPFDPEDFDTIGTLCSLCPNCSETLFLARVGRFDLLLTVNISGNVSHHVDRGLRQKTPTTDQVNQSHQTFLTILPCGHKKL